MRQFPYVCFTWLTVLVLGLTSLLPAKLAMAQEAPPPTDPPPLAGVRPEHGPPGAVADENGLWRMAADTAPVEAATAAASGGPDDYGYTWNDGVPLNWIDATGGTDTGLSGDSFRNQRTGAIPLPFAFKYYDAVYTNVYIGAAGYVSFQDSPDWYWDDQIPIPCPSVPNAVISAYSTPLILATSGKRGHVFYQAGGTAPNRYFVIAWNEVMFVGEDDQYTFEIVLYENGDILLQYKTMTWGADGHYICATVGIEDAEGLDGFNYSMSCVPPSIKSNSIKSIHFTRPAATTRVKLRPRGQGRFTRAANTETFEVTVYNNGELGADTYNVTLNSSWPATLQMGGQALTDTNGDGIPDTGAVGQGERKKLTVQVQTPTFASVADVNTATLTMRSTRNSTVKRTTLLRSTVPTPFAQIYEDGASPGPRLTLLNPDGRITRKLTGVTRWGGEMAVGGTPAGGYLYAWDEWLGGAWQLRYALLDDAGELQTPIQTMATAAPGYFMDLATAVAPNGAIGLSWVQVQSREVNGNWEYNYNVWLSILDAAGGVVLSPTNLTNNGAWTTQASVGAPSFYYTQIAAAEDNHFFVVWNDYHNNGSSWTDNIFYTVRSASGQVVKPLTQLGGADLNGADRPRVAALSGNRFLLAYYGYAGGAQGVRTMALTSAGDLIAGPQLLTDYYESPQAVTQLSNGSILLVWSHWTNDKAGLRYALLSNTSYAITTGPIDLDNPFSYTGDAAPSVIADADGRAVITWGENDWGYRPYHFYALIDGSGALLTPPTPWLAARIPAGGWAPSVTSSYNSYGIARSNSFAPTSATQPDVKVVAPTLSTGAPAGSAQVGIAVSNRGLSLANGVTVTVELDPLLTYLSAEPAPAASAQTATSGGGTYTWNAPDLRYLSQGLILLSTGVPSATVGARYPVTISVGTTGSDVNQGNNTIVTEVMVAEQIYLPNASQGDD
ncbi:hypothetical protein [Caldilinea sp.]|uniref:hypothetical protein n=1 Tax=Caldilinea sp. TaxID=2293560 RepID=UPI002C0F81E2|nr:hypothetical protein [Caldilinea sp.]